MDLPDESLTTGRTESLFAKHVRENKSALAEAMRGT
jgi:hypothetical protein